MPILADIAAVLRWPCQLVLLAAVMDAGAASMDAASSLRALYATAPERFRQSPFDQPLWIDSTDAGGRLEGSIHARIEVPFARTQAALGAPAHWCELMILLPNIRQCRVADDGKRLIVRIVRRFDQLPMDGYAVDFEVDVEHDPQRYLRAALNASRGPFGTHDYRLVLEAIPVAGDRSFVRIRYGYSYGLAARLGAQVYLATRGRDKVGFSVVGRDAGGEPQHVDGLRGGVERNAMRLYLAIDTYLDALDLPGAQRHEHALRTWLTAIERYPRQLSEPDPDAYFEAKRVRL